MLFLQLLLILITQALSFPTIVEKSPASPILRVQDDAAGSNRTIRWGHLLGLQGLTDGRAEIRQPSSGLLFNDVAIFLAFQQFNGRRGDILPHLPSLLDGCDFYWSYESRDTQRKALNGASQLIEAMTDVNMTRTNLKPEPFAFFGAQLSSVSQPLSVLGAAFDLPQISGASTSSELDSSPLFARTISTNEADARGIMVYFQHIGVRYVANVYTYNEWGIFYNTALRKYAYEMGIYLLSLPIDDNKPDSISSTMDDLKASQCRYVFASINPWQRIVDTAYQKGVIGNPDYVWFAGEFSLDTIKFSRHDKTQSARAMALHGIGTINLFSESYPAMDAAMKEITSNPALEEEYMSHLVEQEVFQNVTFQNDSYTHAFRHYTNFDAVIALGLAACNTPDLFSGPELYRQLLHTNFNGTSGQVFFDNKTGTRDATSVSFRIEYVLLSDARSNEEYFQFDSNVTAIVRGDDFTLVAPFVYNNNQTNPPSDFPPLEENLYLISNRSQWVGYTLAAVAMSLSVVCCTWAIVCRQIYVVRAAQPIFLCMLCVGTFLIASAIIPLGIPGASSGYEGTRGLDVACMAPIWLVSLGFVIAFSSIHAKTWRMLKIMRSANQMIRKEVQPKDVILPFFILMAINLVLLVCMTFLSPYEFARVPKHSYDEFRRNNASYATCNYFNNRDALYFAIPLFVVDFLWLVLVLYMAYQARKLSTAFSESRYLVMTVISLFETLLLGGPILVACKDIPTAFFICASFILALSVFAILVPIFLPKYMHRKIERGRSAIQRNTEHGGQGKQSTNPSGASHPSGFSGLDPTSTPFASAAMQSRAGDVEAGSSLAPRLSFLKRFSTMTQSPPAPPSSTKRKTSAMTIKSRDDSWHFEEKRGTSTSKSSNSNKSNHNNIDKKKNRSIRTRQHCLRGSDEHKRQINALGIDKLELEALDLIQDLNLESIDESKSVHSNKTC